MSSFECINYMNFFRKIAVFQLSGVCISVRASLIFLILVSFVSARGALSNELSFKKNEFSPQLHVVLIFGDRYLGLEASQEKKSCTVPLSYYKLSYLNSNCKQLFLNKRLKKKFEKKRNINFNYFLSKANFKF